MDTSIIRPQPVALLVLGLATGLVWMGLMVAPKTSGVLSEPIPTTLGAWVGTPIGVDQHTIDILETDNVKLMEYRLDHGGNEPPIWFAQVAGFGTRAAFHPPELCYVGDHYEVVEHGPITVMVGGVPRRLVRLVLEKGRERFEAWYWFTANGRVTSNYYQQQAWLLLDSMRGKPMSGTLVRLSTPMDDPVAVHQRLLGFVTALVSAPGKASHGA